jgi:hypothetical protein
MRESHSREQRVVGPYREKVLTTIVAFCTPCSSKRISCENAAHDALPRDAALKMLLLMLSMRARAT